MGWVNNITGRGFNKTEGFTLKKMKILVIDDDYDVLDLLKSFFSSLGHAVTTTASSLEGMKYIVGETFDVVFLDIVLPEKDGLTLLQEMKAIDKQLPVVIMTGYKEADKVVEAFRKGAIDCLLKPFNFDYIKNTILTTIIERKK